jgi:hypothetical protein
MLLMDPPGPLEREPSKLRGTVGWQKRKSNEAANSHARDDRITAGQNRLVPIN